MNDPHFICPFGHKIQLSVLGRVLLTIAEDWGIFMISNEFKIK